MIRAYRFVRIAIVCLLCANLAAAARAAGTGAAFPAADPESVGIPPRALQLLAERAQSMVDNQEIVGGELVVIKNRRTVFREAYGWKDREARRPLEADAVYCVRSMTKPLVGTAIQMLIEEGKLRLDTPVREILPFFSGPHTGKITVEHLLTHSGGFPFMTIGKPLSEYADLAAVAAEAAATELLFEPGTGFEYSDAGSDTLGAIVAQITGAPVERFIRQRILDPLGMQDTITLLGNDEATLARIPSAYSGGTGSWTKHWEPSDAPIFPLFLTSQSLYSTTTDYARFLTLWMDDGRVGERRLISAEAVERALAPSRRIDDSPQGFEGLEAYYGQQWVIHAKPVEEGSPQRVVFGHSGSDGTHAWAWPELDLMVLFFTQSRGTLAGVGLEGVLQTLLVEQALDDPSLAARAAGAEQLEQVAGLYWDETNAGAYYVITPRGNGLTFERPGRAYLVFKVGETPDRYVHELNPEVAIEFVRSEEGAVTAMRTVFGGRTETGPRHVPREGLPSPQEVAALVRQAHGVDKLHEIGAVRMSGKLVAETRKIEGTITNLFDATRLRSDVELGPGRQTIVATGGRAWSRATTTGLEQLDGTLEEQVLLSHPAVRLGDWTEHYEQVEVLKRVKRRDGHSLLMLRVVPREAPGSTMFVDEQSGRLLRTEGLVQVPGVGIVGLRTDYGDFRDVGGMKLAFREAATFATPLIGRVVTQIEQVETGVEVAADVFSLPAEAGE